MKRFCTSTHILRKTCLSLVATASLCFVIGLATTHAASVIDTRIGSFGGVSQFGEFNTATYGQTFTVTGPETVLNDFTFWVNDDLNPDFVDFAGYVMAWDGGKATGAILFQSGMLSTTNNGGAGGLEQFTFPTGGIALTAGNQYVAFLSASDYFDGQRGTGSMLLSIGSSYSGGQFVHFNNGSNFNLLTTNAWTIIGGNRDVEFVANFSTPGVAPVPEPSTMLLLGSGLVGLIGYRMKKARA